ncbi:hypothetical protein DYI24_20895 [Rhodopseudomonas sp. BR0C11]|uniref:hypothetical protein n=1 Tax=Rhodopseudomonas sp. BR0C11 TaxID=2269370 RepID=UPI0013DECDC6|nr:hypothetical protein [Rhodopseudomonas sp. BR0C11]NEV79497.1 hypothetical protein [Rhodopseudomonas sp. BR0C11]
MSQPDSSDIRLSPAEQLSFLSARAVATGQAFVRTRNQQELARDLAELTAQVAQLPEAAQVLPLFAFLGVHIQALSLAPMVSADRLEWLALVIFANERLLRTANRDLHATSHCIAGAD